ncbi:hypothetical protein [Amniculibacterium sp. G2-70]|uniref:hypothetical protein n=1 Tax=Amniculibacterium sp. G2-70 TaxID=2767188 RepID=UPI00165434F3|nr:hypothetical protein [Amniculibacterium sp. G2-70]
MKYTLIIIIFLCFSCGDKKALEKFQQFDLKQKKITKGMPFKQVSEIIGVPEFINLRDSIFIGKYNYGNIDGYRFTVGFSKDSLVLWKEYEN